MITKLFYFTVFSNWRVTFIVKVFIYYALECLCEFRVYNAICVVPRYGVDHYRGVGQTMVSVFQRRSNLSV